MSREFGDYQGGYFHDKINNAANDAERGGFEITRLWGEFLSEFYHVAHAISSAEAADSWVDRPIAETISRLPNLWAALNKIDGYVKPYERVAENAVRDYIRQQEKD